MTTALWIVSCVGVFAAGYLTRGHVEVLRLRRRTRVTRFTVS